MPDTPINVKPADGATDVSVTPTLAGSVFSSETTVTIPGGQPDPDYRIGLSVTEDGVVYGPEIYRSMGEYGQYAHQIEWGGGGGIGMFESMMGLRFRTNAPIEFSVDSLVADVD